MITEYRFDKILNVSDTNAFHIMIDVSVINQHIIILAVFTQDKP